MAGELATAPSNFSVSKNSAAPGESITFTWGPSSAGGSNVVLEGYRIRSFNNAIGQYFTMPGASDIPLSSRSFTGTFPTNVPVGDYVIYYIQAIATDNSTGASAGGASSGYIYVYAAELEPIAPPYPTYITVSEPEQGDPVEIAWGSVSGATYVLERSVNGGTFASLYSGSSISYTDTAGSTWNTVQYRVKAVVSGASSDWTVSAVRTVQKPEQPEPTTPAAGRLEQFQNRNGTNIYPKTVIEGVFRQSDGKSLSELIAGAGTSMEFYVDPADGHLYREG